MTSASTRQRIREFLATHTTLTLATVAETGQPQAASLFFAETDTLDLIFISEQKVRHSQNIGRDQRVAATIYADGQSWQSIRGLQLEGRCEAIPPDAVQPARDVYLAKYPFIAENKFLAEMLDKVTFYKISPVWVRLIDNTQGFGHKEELRF